MSHLFEPSGGASKSEKIRFADQGVIREVNYYKEQIKDVLKDISKKRLLANQKKVQTNKLYPNLANSGNKIADFLLKTKSTDLNFVQKGVEDIISKAKHVKLDDRITTTVVGGHGVLTLGNFLVIPKNTIIITFVNDGRLHLDTKVSGGKMDMIEWYHFVYLWIENLVEIVKLFGDNISVDVIKEYMQYFVKSKMVLLNKYKKMKAHEYWLINNDIVMYSENDVIPEQKISFHDADFTGIHDWQTEMRNYVKMTEYMSNVQGGYDRTKFHFYQPFEDTSHIFYGVEKDAAMDHEQKGVPSIYLSNLLNYMETKRQEKTAQEAKGTAAHADQRFAGNLSKKSGPNILIISACRGLNGDIITVKPHVSFLYKNIFYQFDYLLNNKKLLSSVNKSKFEDYVYSEIQKLYNRYRNKPFQDMEGLYDIFFKKICFLATNQSIRRAVTLYYEDAKVAVDKITDDVLEVHVPARDGNGEMLNTKMQSMPFEKNWFDVVNFVNSNPENMFYVPRNPNSKFVLDMLQIVNLDITSFQNRLDFWNLETRKTIFQQWEISINKYIHKNFKETHIQIMRLLFVDLKRMDNQEVVTLANNSSAPFVYLTLFLYNPNRAQNFQMFYINQVSEEIIYALIYFKDRSIDPRNNKFTILYKSDIIRDQSFPYLTPIEFALANYYYEPTSTPISHLSFLDLAKKLLTLGENATKDSSTFIFDPNFFSPDVKTKYFICNYASVYDSLQLLRLLFKKVVASLISQTQGKKNIESKDIQQIKFRYQYQGGEIGPDLNQVDFFKLYFFLVWYQQIFVGLAKYQPKKIIQLPSALIFYMDEVLSNYSKYNLLDVDYTENAMNNNIKISKSEMDMEEVMYSLKYFFGEGQDAQGAAKPIGTADAEPARPPLVGPTPNVTQFESSINTTTLNADSFGFLADDFKVKCRTANFETLKKLIINKLDEVKRVFAVQNVPIREQRNIVLELYGFFETVADFSVYVFFFEGMIEMVPQNMYIYTFIKRYYSNYFLLEADREYEMWMFPVVGDNLVFDKVSFPFHQKGANRLKQSVYGSQNFLNFYLIMLDFYGFTMVDGLSGEIIADPNFVSIERTVHLLSKAVNVKKLIRIIVSLFFCGFRSYGTSLYSKMKDYINDVAKVSDDPAKIRDYFMKISNYVNKTNSLSNYYENILLVNIKQNYNVSAIPIIINFNNLKYKK